MNPVLKTLFVTATLSLLGTFAVAADNDAKVTSLMSKDLPNYPGKEGLMISVEYGPGGAIPFTSMTQMRSSTSSKARS